MSFYSYISNKIDIFLTNYNLSYNIIFIVILVILFIGLCYLSYVRYLKPVIGNKSVYKDLANNNQKEIEVFFVFADWCPYCTKSLNDWNTFSNQNNNKVINDYLVICSKIDCSKTTDADVKNYIDENKIKSFPTVYITKDNTRYDFDAPVNNANLTTFLTKVSSM